MIKYISINTYFFLVLLTFFTAFQESRSQTIIASSTFNNTNVIIDNIYDPAIVPYSNERDWRYRTGGADRDLGQTFTLAAAEQLKAITVRISDNNTNSMQSGVFNESFTLRLYSTTNVNSLVATDYTLITSVAYTFPNSSSVNRGDFLRMEFDTPISLAAGGYAFMLIWDTESANKIVKLHHSGAVGGNYTGGRALEQNFGSGTGDVRPAFAPGVFDTGTRDLSFAITVIPEPAACMLSRFGCSCCLDNTQALGESNSRIFFCTKLIPC